MMDERFAMAYREQCRSSLPDLDEYCGDILSRDLL